MCYCVFCMVINDWFDGIGNDRDINNVFYVFGNDEVKKIFFLNCIDVFNSCLNRDISIKFLFDVFWKIIL